MSTEISEIKTYFGRCGCCLNYGYLKNMWKKYHCDDKIEVYGEMLTQCYALSMDHPESKEHDKICETCISRLREAYDFRKLVIESQKEIMEVIQNDLKSLDFKVEIVKIEPIKYDDEMETITAICGDDRTADIEEGVLDKGGDEERLYENVEYLDEEIVVLDSEGDKAAPLSSGSDETATRRKRKYPKKLPPNERNKRYLQYTADDLREALDAVRSNKMSKSESSQYYNVPRKTLSAKLKLEEEDGPDENKAKLTVDKGESKYEEQSRDNKTASDAEHVASRTRKPVNGLLEEMNKHRDNIRTLLQCSNATMVKAHGSGGYTCCFCPKQFPSPADMKRHNLDAHEDASTKAIHVKYVSDLVIKLDITGLRCIVCGMKGTALEPFMDHLKREHAKPIHNDVKNYIIPFKFDTDKLQCVACSKQFVYFKVLSEHMNEHYRNFECPVCDRGFINKQSLSTHSYRHQKNIGEFKCSHCAKVFDTRHKRSAHVRRIHLYRGKTRKCHVCNEKFTSSPQVQNHMVKVHGAEPLVFKCGACDKSYNNSRSLNDHKKRYHLMLRPHKCTLCDMSFYSRMELNTHMVTHTKTKEFQCDICDKRFGTKCCLSQHMRSHYGIKRHKCERCDIKYAARSKWRLHMWKKHREVV